jgi:hypothetical protein
MSCAYADVFFLNSPFRQVLTGSYHNYFRIYDTEGSNDIVLQADKSVLKTKKIGPGGKSRQTVLREAMQSEPQDFNKKILHASWHPKEATVAVSLFYFYLLSSSPLYYSVCHIKPPPDRGDEQPVCL